jgi:hypothetical protein
MRIVLHGGFHKTGTTSLQAGLEAHRPALAGRVLVQTLQLTPELARATEAARAFSLRPDAGLLQTAMADWVAGLPDPAAHDLAISSEDFAGHMPGRFGVPDYRAAVATIPAAVQALRGRFPGAEVTVLMTLRAAEPWLKSLHWQLSIHPELMLKQRRFCKEFAAAAAFEAVTGPLAQALAGAAVLRLASLEGLTLRRLGPVEAVYDALDLPDTLRASLRALPRRNARAAEGLADQFVTLNRAKLAPAELRRAKSAMQAVMQALEAE